MEQKEPGIGIIARQIIHNADLRKVFSQERVGLYFAWVGKGAWAIADQALFSGSSFLVNILLARWLAPEAYGAFAVALSIYYLLLNFHNALLTEPMMVFGAGKYRDGFRQYLGILFFGHWGLSVGIAFILGIVALVMKQLGSLPMAQALAGLALASPFLLLLCLARRVPYVELRPQWATLGGGVNLIVTIIALYLFWHTGLLSAFSGILILGVAEGVTSALLLLLFRPSFQGLTSKSRLQTVIKDHKRYGGWNLLGTAAYWASGQIVLIVAPIFLGLTSSATISAILNIYRPASLFVQSIGLMVLPVFSRWATEGVKGKRLHKKVAQIALLIGGSVALYSCVFTITSRPILNLFYSGKYQEHWTLVGLFGLLTTASAFVSIFTSALKAEQRVSEVSKIWMLSVVFVAVFSVPMILLMKTEGVAMSMALAYALAAWRAFKKLELNG